MIKMLLVLRHELLTTITRRSFLLVTFGMPLVSALLFGSVALSNLSSLGQVLQLLLSGSAGERLPEGYVDQAQVIQQLPPGVTGADLVEFPDEVAAQQALQAGQIRSYYLLPPDYLQRGQIIYIRPDFNPLSAFNEARLMRWVVRVNLLGGDVLLAARVERPAEVDLAVRQPAQPRGRDEPLTFLLPYVVTMLYYMVVMMTASLLLSSITREKENRVMEVLMMTVTPRQLLGGKIIGLGLVGLLQVLLWACGGLLALRLSGRAFTIPEVFQLPPSFVLWATLFFWLGYTVYACLMAGVGALVPNLREASQVTFVILLPIVIPMMLISLVIDDPNGPLATGLSLFPLTAPVAIMTRLSAGTPPIWQVLLSAAIQVLSAVLIIAAVAKLFRAQTLLTGQAFSWRRAFRLLRE